MRNLFFFFNCFVWCLIATTSSVVLFSQTTPNSPPKSEQHRVKPVKTVTKLLGTIPALTTIPEIAPQHQTLNKKKLMQFHNNKLRNYRNNPNPLPIGEDPVRQKGQWRDGENEIDTVLYVEGLAYIDIHPPDPSGDVGPNHYIQMVNSASGSVIQIWDKEMNLLYGPSTLNNIWQQIGAPVGIGDPIVSYDQAADRWVLLEMTWEGKLNIAVSKTADPLGEWYAYVMQGDGSLPDYPKLSIWNNFYYITTNEFNNYSPIYVLNRQEMIDGVSTAQTLLFKIPKFIPGPPVESFQPGIPVDWDGKNTPPANMPGMVMRMYDDAWNGDVDKLEIWDVIVDWSDVDKAEVVGPFDLPTEPFEAQVCEGWFTCIDQPDGGPAFEALDQIIHMRAQYRNFGSYQSIVLNHVVDATGTEIAGKRWYELRKLTSAGGEWYIYQQGTYAPDDESRFMGSIAMDGTGNIALGYAVAGFNTYPSLRLTGRMAGDPLGQMTVKEVTVGEGKVVNLGQRWGDYSHMTVDPVDEQTFWFTGEYLPEGSNGTTWATKIIAFTLRRDTNDLAMQAIVNPYSKGQLTTTESVTVNLRNAGINAQSNFEVSYSVNNSPAITEIYSGTIEPNQEANYTFKKTGDFSTPGAYYHIKAWVTLNTDTNPNNNEVSTTIKHIAPIDVEAYAILGLGNSKCSANSSVGLVLRNAGWDNLTSATLVGKLKGQPAVVTEWTGSLAYNAKDTIWLEVEGLKTGLNEYFFNVDNPNNKTDLDGTNNSKNLKFSLDVSQSQIHVNILTDDQPSEVYLNITSEDGLTQITSIQNLQNPQFLYKIPICLKYGACYQINYNDLGWNGMNAGATGAITVTTETNDTIFELPEPATTSSYYQPICIEAPCNLNIITKITNETAVNAKDGTILVEAKNGTSPYEYSKDNIGWQSSPLFQGLKAGQYTIWVRDAKTCKESITAIVENKCSRRYQPYRQRFCQRNN
jgi:hypothetical protein